MKQVSRAEPNIEMKFSRELNQILNIHCIILATYKSQSKTTLQSTEKMLIFLVKGNQDLIKLSALKLVAITLF